MKISDDRKIYPDSKEASTLISTQPVPHVVNYAILMIKQKMEVVIVLCKY